MGFKASVTKSRDWQANDCVRWFIQEDEAHLRSGSMCLWLLQGFFNVINRFFLASFKPVHFVVPQIMYVIRGIKRSCIVLINAMTYVL